MEHVSSIFDNGSSHYFTINSQLFSILDRIRNPAFVHSLNQLQNSGKVMRSNDSPDIIVSESMDTDALLAAQLALYDNLCHANVSDSIVFVVGVGRGRLRTIDWPND